MFSCGEISAFFAKQIFFSGVELNSSLHYQDFQVFKFDINIQILVWIFGSTYIYRKGEILKAKVTCQLSIFFTVTRDTQWSRSGNNVSF